MITIEEAIAMRGTEFEFEFNDGSTIQGYVKEFDPKKALSCWSFGLVTSTGFEFEPKNKDEEAEGAICIIGFDLKEEPEKLKKALKILDEIKRTGRRVRAKSTGGTLPAALCKTENILSGCSSMVEPYSKQPSM